MTALAKPFVGRWRIFEMDLWDQDYLDLAEPAFIRFDADRTGEFLFGLVAGNLDCRYSKSKVVFKWQGHDDIDDASGHGEARRLSDGTIKGHLFFDLSGEESGFRARKW